MMASYCEMTAQIGVHPSPESCFFAVERANMDELVDYHKRLVTTATPILVEGLRQNHLFDNANAMSVDTLCEWALDAAAMLIKKSEETEP